MRAAALLLTLLLLGWGGYEGYGRVRAESLVESIVTAETADVPGLVKQLPAYRGWANPRLLRHLHDSPEDSKEHLHASLALLPADEGQTDYLYERLVKAGPTELPVIRDALLPQHEALRERLWNVLEDGKNDPDQRLRAACALAKYADADARWEKVGGDVAAKLMTENPLVVGKWLDALRPVGGILLPPLAAVLEDENQSVSELRTAANLYGPLAESQPGAFAPLEAWLAKRSEPDAKPDAKLALAKRQANIGAALLAMGRTEQVWPLLKHSPTPPFAAF